jgi:hypothetical protein
MSEVGARPNGGNDSLLVEGVELVRFTVQVTMSGFASTVVQRNRPKSILTGRSAVRD